MTITTDKEIGQLKDAIYKKGKEGPFMKTDARDMALLKVRAGLLPAGNLFVKLETLILPSAQETGRLATGIKSLGTDPGAICSGSVIRNCRRAH